MIDVATAHLSPPLTELDKEEFWQIAQAVRPDMTRAEYDAHWEDFARKKAAGYFEHGVN